MKIYTVQDVFKVGLAAVPGLLKLGSIHTAWLWSYLAINAEVMVQPYKNVCNKVADRIVFS